MRRRGSVAPAGAFTTNMLWDGFIEIRFYENVQMVTRELDNGTDITEWEYDEFIIRRPYYANLGTDIEANYDVWLQAAKAEEEARTPVDAWQLRADVDFLQITQAAAMGISLMSEGSDLDVLEKARQYYPKRWSKEQLMMLVQIQKLSQEDYQGITGEMIQS